MRHCAISDFIFYTSFDCPNEPTFILSRNCTNEYYGANGPCCKVDDGINYLVNDRPKLFEHIKFILHCDDDEYWRADQTLKWLAAVQNSGINHFPIIANGDPYTVRPLNPEPARLAVHYLKPFDEEDYCNEEQRWPASDRYNQVLALGCGSVERRGPFHNTTKHPTHADNYDMFEYFRDHGKDIVVGKVRRLEQEQLQYSVSIMTD